MPNRSLFGVVVEEGATDDNLEESAKGEGTKASEINNAKSKKVTVYNLHATQFSEGTDISSRCEAFTK